MSIKKIRDIAKLICQHKFSQSDNGADYLAHIENIHKLMEEYLVPIDNHTPAGVPLRLLKGICIAMDDILFWEQISPEISDLKWINKENKDDLIKRLSYRYNLYDFEKYKYSFTNPVQSCALLGEETGKYFCTFYYAVIRLHSSSVKKHKKIFKAARNGCAKIAKEILKRLEYVVESDDSLNESPEFIKEFNTIIKEAAIEFLNIRSMVAAENMDKSHIPDKTFENRVLATYKKAGIDTLRLRPWKSHEEASKVTEIFSRLSDLEVKTAIKELLAGFKRGADVAGLEIKKGDIYSFHYVEGMERLALEFKKQTEKMGLEFKGQCSPIVKDNHQELYDHKNDFHISLTDKFIASYSKQVEKSMKKAAKWMKKLRGNIVMEFYGEDLYSPEQHDKQLPFMGERFQKYQTVLMELSKEYQPPENMSFSICALPHPHIGPDIEVLLQKSLSLIALPLSVWSNAQQKIVELLDNADHVRVKGANGSGTDIKIGFYKGHDLKKQTAFCSVLADLNFPVGEVFTTPKLDETAGILHIPGELFFNGLPYKELYLKYENGRIVDYGCSNFDDAQQCKNYMAENLFNNKPELPMGEFAIGTNKILDRMVRDHNIPQSKLSVLLIEKMGPHFAFGDTCFTMRETQGARNDDGRDVVARCNEISDPASGKPAHERYFFIHVDVTLPYQYTGQIAAYLPDESNETGFKEVDIVRNGQFVLPGTEILNVEELDDPRLKV